MHFHLIYFVVLLSPVLSRQIPNISDLDEDEQHLFRAAYDTPSYDHDEYEDDMQVGKLDLVKDGLWALKAKMKELKAFNKALAANMLATKLQVKDLLKNHLMTVKKHHHKKASYDYHAPSYQAPSYHYEAQYAPAAAPQYHEPYEAIAPQQYRHDPYYGH